MARVQYGSIVTELKGKISGQVFQGGNVGFVLRNKGYTPGISSSQRQTANRGMIAQTTAWKLLTDEQRATWNSGAANWPFTDKFGNSYTGSGFQVFTAFNSNRVSLGLSVITSMPSSASPNNPGAVAVTVDTDGDLIVEWENVSDADVYVAIWATAIVSTGRNTNHARYRRLGSTSATGGTDTSAIGYGVDGEPFPAPPLGSVVIVKVAWYKGAFPYKYFESINRVVVTVP